METSKSPDPGARILERLADAIDQLGGRGRIGQWDEQVVAVVGIIGEIFRHGLRGGFAQLLLSGTPTFWPFVREFSAPGTIQIVRALPDTMPLFSNSMERENAWIIAALNSGDFPIYLSMIRRDQKLVRMFYSDKANALLLDKHVLERLEAQMTRLEEEVDFDLSFEDYVQFLKAKARSKSKSKAGRPETANKAKDDILPDLDSMHKGRLYSPIPMIRAKDECSISSPMPVPSDKERAVHVESPVLDPAPSSQSNASRDVSEDGPFDMEMEEGPSPAGEQRERKHSYLSQFRRFIEESPPTSKHSSPREQPQRPDSDMADDETGEDRHQVLVPTPTPTPAASPSQEVSPIDSMSRPSLEGREDDIRGSPRTTPLVTLPEEVIAQAMEELNHIVEKPRPARLTLVETSIEGSAVPLPAIVDTPPRDPIYVTQHPETSFSTPSVSSHSNELGFFGIPLNVKSITGLLYPMADIVARVARSVDILSILESENEEGNSRGELRFPVDAKTFLDPAVRPSPSMLRGSDGFELELRVCPATGLAAQSYQCIECQTPLCEANLDNLNLCDITGKYFCNACFGNATLISPARILRDWDFDERLVAASVSREYSKHLRKTLIDLATVAPHLLEAQEEVQAVNRLRNALLLAREYVEGCPSGIFSQLATKFRLFPHLLQSPTFYTVQDLLDVHAGLLQRLLAAALRKLDYHIRHVCQRCRLLGRFCALCHAAEPIFYYDVEGVVECPRCLMLTHRACAARERDCVNCRRVHLSVMSPSVDPVPSLDMDIDVA